MLLVLQYSIYLIQLPGLVENKTKATMLYPENRIFAQTHKTQHPDTKTNTPALPLGQIAALYSLSSPPPLLWELFQKARAASTFS